LKTSKIYGEPNISKFWLIVAKSELKKFFRFGTVWHLTHLVPMT